jgi:tetratricopeptide (TPR) repeat protein
MRDVDPEILALIRNAAFELRTSDPLAAVRVLRRLAAAGGPAEVLARGALGEIYFEELGDLDGAEHEFRRVLALAPGLAAAQLGLARVLRESGAEREAQAYYRGAIASLAAEVDGFRNLAAEGTAIPSGAEEVVLSLLEAAVEVAEPGALSAEHAAKMASSPANKGGDGAGAAHDGAALFDETLLDWAVRERLFDALSQDEGDSIDDWVRFHSLSATFLSRTGRPREAAEARGRADAVLQGAMDAARARLDAVPAEERGRLEEEIRAYREALGDGAEGLVTLRSRKN